MNDANALMAILDEKGYSHTQAYLLGYIWGMLSDDQKESVNQAIQATPTIDELMAKYERSKSDA